MVVDEVVAGEGPVDALGFVEHRHVWLNVLFIGQPVEHLCRAIGGIGGETPGGKIKAVTSSRDHGFGGSDFGLAYGSRGLDINDHGVIEINQVVGGVGKEREAAV